MAQPPLLCAECDVPATVLIVHPHLYKMVIPSCGRHGELEAGVELEILPVDSPVATSYTVLRGFIVPRSGA